MSTKADELKLDIAELTSLQEQATRQRSKNVLAIELNKLKTEYSLLIKENHEEVVKPVDTPAPQKRYEVKLTNYGWDQTNTMVKLYVSINGVQNLPKEAVVCNFTETSVDLTILGLDNKNYHLLINNLCEEIDMDKSYVRVKTDIVIVSLVKKVKKTWSHVTGIEKMREQKTTAALGMEKDGSPSESLMNLLGKMYREGDDELKKTMSKVWTETQANSKAVWDA